ncbi:MAG: hypothetical protein HYX75_17190 [Acidobacteria bacterium]|nr:hypothetical protein [Acidobacteriota bacterium]
MKHEKEMGTSEKYSDPSAYGTIVVGFVGAILTVAIIIGLQALFYSVEQEENLQKVYSQSAEELARLRAEQLELLNSYRWIDREKGIVGIPIDRAMEMTVRELNAPATPVVEDQP